MTSAEMLITRALQLIGVVAAGELPSPDDFGDGLITLNDMAAAWATERLTIYQQARVTQLLVANTQTYTIGTGAVINTPRPLWLPEAGIIPATANTLEVPIDVISEDQWAGVVLKTQTSTFPTKVYYDYGFSAAGYGTITVWPVPTTAPTLVLYLPAAIANFADGSTKYLFPPGYERMLRYNLAIDLAPEYGKPLDPVIAMIAAQSKANVKRANNRLEDLRVDTALLRRGGLWNYRTGSGG